MIPIYLAPLANHLWQSTLLAGVAAMFALVLRKDRAALRYAIWLAASVKFLVPFSLLVSVGRSFSWSPAISIADPSIFAIVSDISRPFAATAASAVVRPKLAAEELLPFVLFGVWLLGVATVF